MRPNALIRTLALLLLALLPRLMIVAQPIPVQLDKTLPDDSYYYYLTAQHMIAVDSPSVDGMHPSNGWHPLWMLLANGVWRLPFGDLDAPVRVMLALGALCDSLVAVVLYRAGRRYIGEAAWFGALIYAINTMPMFQAVNGLETGLAALFIALAWACTLYFVEYPSWRAGVEWGAIFGLCFLARTDTAMILVFLGLFALVKLRSLQTLRYIVLAGGVAVVVITPWLLWNQANFGAPLEQTSSTAVPWAAQTRHMAANPDSDALTHGLSVLSQAQYWLRGDYFGTPPLISLILWAAALIGVAWAWRKREARSLGAMVFLLAAGGVALLLVHTLIRFYPRPWYFVVMAQSLSIGLALFWYYAGKRIRLAAMSVIMPLMLISGILAWNTGYYPWQQQLQYAGALWVRDNIPPTTIVSAMNSGVIGYYGGRPTINLDGVVNPQAVAAMREYRLLDFAKEAGAEYLLDVDYALEGEYGFFMGDDYRERLTEIAVIGEPYEGLGSMRIYRID